MVLTNFECWAHGVPNAEAADFDGTIGATGASRHVDPFNPRAVQQTLGAQSAAVSHISSNGYYGFSYVNAAHEPNNNNDDNIADTTITHNNNGTLGNDVNGMMQTNVAAAAAAGATRCKKRFFVSDDDYNFVLLNNGTDAAGGVGLNVGGAAKRCRFDDDYAAQYCNDFFNLPSTQIGTQSCLMDTEDYGIPQQQQLQQQQQFHTQQQPQVDVAMTATYATSPTTTTQNNFINNSQSNLHINQSQSPQQQQQAASLQQMQSQTQQPHYHSNNYQEDYEGNSSTTCINVLDSFFNSTSTTTTLNTTTFPIPNSGNNSNNNLNVLNEEVLVVKQHLQNHNNNYCQNIQNVVQMGSSRLSQSAANAADDNVVADAASMFATIHGGSTYQFVVAAHANFNQEADI